MGSKFLGVYVGDQKNINKVIGSGDGSYLSQLALSDDLLPYAEKLITGAYSRDPETHEAPDAHNLIYAFEEICKKESAEHEVLEVYIDDEETPELWNLHIAEWSQPVELKLPLSEYGYPMVTFLDAAALVEHEHALSEKATSGSNDEQFINDADMASLLKLIRSAIAKSFGVYLFYCE